MGKDGWTWAWIRDGGCRGIGVKRWRDHVPGGIFRWPLLQRDLRVWKAVKSANMRNKLKTFVWLNVNYCRHFILCGGFYLRLHIPTSAYTPCLTIREEEVVGWLTGIQLAWNRHSVGAVGWRLTGGWGVGEALLWALCWEQPGGDREHIVCEMLQALKEL